MGNGGDVDLSNYYTKVETDNALNSKANKVHAHSEYLTEHQDISHKADKENTYTKTQTDNKISEEITKAQLGGDNEVDLSAYATKTYVDDEISKIIIENGNLVLRDIEDGEIFEIEGNEPTSPTVEYGNIITSTSSLSVNENSTTTFTVSLDKAPTNDQVVNILVNNDYCILDKTNLIFTPSNYNIVQTIIVSGVHDSANYSDKLSLITASSINVPNKVISVNIKNIDSQPSTNIPVSSVSLDKEMHIMKIGETIQLNATVLPTNATNKNVIWSSSNSNATVENGLVTAKAKGECVITCEALDGNKTASCIIDVQEEEVINNYTTRGNLLSYDFRNINNSTEIRDISENNNNATLSQASTSSNNSLTLINKSVISMNEILMPSSQFSLEYYAYIGNGNGRLICIGDNSNTNGLFINLSNSYGTLQCNYNKTAQPSIYNAIYSKENAYKDNTYHVVFVKENSVMKLYVNGVLNNSVTINTSLDVISSKLYINCELRDGVESSGFSRDVKVKAVRAYDVALTSEEVENNYNYEVARG